VVVAAVYKEIRGFSANVLNDVDEKNFDWAFNLIRPIIQGTGDLGVNLKATGNQELSEEEILATMDFVFRIFASPSKKAGENHDHSDVVRQGNVANLNTDARARLEAL
jgi:hypothetical protein